MEFAGGSLELLMDLGRYTFIELILFLALEIFG
jgi:hypothetical protein